MYTAVDSRLTEQPLRPCSAAAQERPAAMQWTQALQEPDTEPPALQQGDGTRNTPRQARLPHHSSPLHTGSPVKQAQLPRYSRCTSPGSKHEVQQLPSLFVSRIPSELQATSASSPPELACRQLEQSRRARKSRSCKPCPTSRTQTWAKTSSHAGLSRTSRSAAAGRWRSRCSSPHQLVPSKRSSAARYAQTSDFVVNSAAANGCTVQSMGI